MSAFGGWCARCHSPKGYGGASPRGRLRPWPLLLPLLVIPLTAAALPAAGAPVGPFTFCYGLERGGPPGLPQELGLNTLYVDLLPGDLLDLQPCRNLIHTAQRNGLKVIIGLPTCLTAQYRVSPYDEHYCATVRELIASVVGRLKDEPGVSAWGTGHALEKTLSYTDADFRLYLQSLYPSLEALNTSWGAQLATWPQVMMALARELDAKLPFRVGRASVDLADYNRQAYHDTMALWLAAIREADPRRPVLTGRVTLYRSLAAIPDGYAIVCTSFPPDVVEEDLLTHNAQALDLARRGGKFHVLPVLRIPSNASPAYGDGSMRTWIQQAALHGAVGFGLEDWPLLSEVYQVEQRVPARQRRLLGAIAAARTVQFGFEPRPTAAVVFSPYAEGVEVTGQPLYGYMREYLPGEPSGLMQALRLGTCYGLVDYLTVDDLGGADLRQYGALLLPACLKVPRAAELLLDDYIGRGGAVMADLGAGFYESGSWLQPPAALMEAAGLLQLGNLKERAGDLTTAAVIPAGLPQLPRGMKSTGSFGGGSGATGTATRRRPYTFAGPTAEALLAQSAAPLATASVRFDEQKRPIFSGLVGRCAGSGLALFATHPLWQYWPLEEPLSLALHGALLRRGAAYELLGDDLLSGNPCFAGGSTEVALLNAGRQPLSAQLWAYAAGGHAYAGAISSFTATPLQEGLPAGSALLVAALPAETLTRLPRSALLVQPYTAEATVALDQYGPGQVVFRVSGAGATVGGSPGRGLTLHGGGSVEVRLVLGSGAYPVAPRSRHLVVTRTRGGRELRETLTANERGELDLSGTCRQETVTVTPAG